MNSMNNLSTVWSFTKNNRRLAQIRSNQHIATSLVQNVHPCVS